MTQEERSAIANGRVTVDDEYDGQISIWLPMQRPTADMAQFIAEAIREKLEREP
jgi:hypothetical protein